MASAYATAESIAAVAFSEAALLEAKAGQEIDLAIQVASAEADSYLRKAVTLPLASPFDPAIVFHASRLAAHALFFFDAPPDVMERLREMRKDALAYFAMVAAGDAAPVLTPETDPTADPASTSGAGYVASLPERGW